MDLREEILKELNKKKLTSKKLYSLMRLKGEEEQAAFFSILSKLEEEGSIYLDDQGYYQIFDISKLGKVQGIIHINKTGNGFVKKQFENCRKKYLIKEKDLNGALDGDIVVLSQMSKGKGNYVDAKVEKIIKRTDNNPIFEYDGNDFVPYNAYGNIKVVCPKEQLKNIVRGNLVLVKLDKEIIARKDDKLVFSGSVEAVVGHKDDPNIDVKAIGANHGFLTDFPPEVIEELKQIKDYVTEDEMEGRVDLRDERIFTIDGKDTKDMDDAISIEKVDGKYILSVHIADVSHYVKEGSYLDKEARLRGTSAYLADSVLPMLPHQLSNGICSLNENEDRLTKTVRMTFDKNGKLIDYDIFDSVIRSKKKMNYDDVNSILESGIYLKDYEEFLPDLYTMRELSFILKAKRKNKGNIDFCSTEIKPIVTKEGVPMSFENRHQKTAEKIVENFMIAANETVTTHYSYMNLPFVYRVHGDPHSGKLLETLKFLKSEGLCNGNANNLINKINNGKYSSKDLEEFLDSFKGTENYSVISNYILSSMSKARYSNINEGHYGLALRNYTHFTSPIRRYPDLQVHRLIDYYNEFEDVYDKLDEIEAMLPEVCNHSSYMERQADIAEAETLELKMAEYSKKHIGDQFRGQIVKFTPYGVNVKLENNIRGIVSPEDISKAKRKLNRKFKLGDKVYTVVKDVSIPHRVIYLGITELLDLKPKCKQKKKLR